MSDRAPQDPLALRLQFLRGVGPRKATDLAKAGLATIEDLLRHEGGMSDWLTDKYTRMNWLIQHPNGKVGPKTAVQNLLPRGEIGDFDYSNSSFTLITLAAEKATGASWRELMQMSEEDLKKRLKELSPQTYTGFAAKLAKDVVKF